MAAGAKTGGRTKGTPNKVTAAKVAAIEASGLTPLEFMLSVLRDTSKDTDERMDAAKAAAPYVHAKLSNIEHTGETTVNLVSPNPMSDDEWAEAVDAD